LVFRHALTREALMAGWPADELAIWARRARAALDSAHPELPGRWCALAAELAALAGDSGDAAALLLRASSRTAAAGAVTTAAGLLERARGLAGENGSVGLDIAEQHIHVAALGGDLGAATERAAEVLAAPDPLRRACVHLRLAEAASEAAHWMRARHELAAARRLVGDDVQRLHIDQILSGQGPYGVRSPESGRRASRTWLWRARPGVVRVWGFCPPVRPRARAARPSRVRSDMRVCSNSAMEPRMWKNIRPTAGPGDAAGTDHRLPAANTGLTGLGDHYSPVS
jgi:hypothetical protein